jgi:hypothetical protein
VSTPSVSQAAAWDKHLRSLAAGYRGIKSTQDIAATLDAAIAEIDQFRARVAELEAGEVTTEWAVLWPGDPDGVTPDEVYEGYERFEATARRVVKQYRGEGVTLQQRTVRTWRSPWTEVAS